MNHLNKAFTLSLFCSLTIANPFENMYQKIKNLTPSEFILESKKEDYWFAYLAANQAGTVSSCCWNKQAGENKSFQSCDLNNEINAIGYKENSLIAENNHIYIQVKNRKISNVLPLGEHCEVNSESMNVFWLEDVQQKQSVDFLEKLALESIAEKSNHALMALASHQSELASKTLIKLSKSSLQKTAKDAVFWIGASRKNGLNHLKKLYAELPKGEVRKQINFATSLIKSKEASLFLQSIALNDESREQRSDALFWLAEADPESTKKIILKLLEDESSDIGNLIYSLSRLPNGQGDETMLKLLTDDYSNEIKKSSLFWLSQSDNQETINKLQSLF